MPFVIFPMKRVLPLSTKADEFFQNWKFSNGMGCYQSSNRVGPDSQASQSDKGDELNTFGTKPEVFLAIKRDVEAVSLKNKYNRNPDLRNNATMIAQTHKLQKKKLNSAANQPKLVDVTLVYKVPSSSLVLDPFDIVMKDHDIVERQFNVFDIDTDMNKIINGLTKTDRKK